MSKYGYLEVFFEGPFDFEITRVDCTFFDIRGYLSEFEVPRVTCTSFYLAYDVK